MNARLSLLCPVLAAAWLLPAPGSARADRPTVKLLKSGSGPKQALRYNLRTNHDEIMVMRMTMGMRFKMGAMTIPEVTLPNMEMKMKISITKQLSKHEARQEFKTLAVTATTRPGVQPGVLETMQKSLDGLKSLKGSAIIDTRGHTREVVIDTSGLNAESKQLMQGMQQGLDQLAVPFPAEAVGKGAKWKVPQIITQNGMSINQVTTFELVALKGKRGKLRVELVQSAKPQTLQLPGTTGTAELLSHKATGSGTIEFDLDSMTPTSSVTMTGDYTMSVSMQGRTEKVATHMTITMALARSK